MLSTSMLAPLSAYIRKTRTLYFQAKLFPRFSTTIPDKNMAKESTLRSDTSGDVQNNVYVQHAKNTDMMTISFQYTSCGKTKSFNLYRKANEPLSATLERLKLNLSKLNKKKNLKETNKSHGKDVFQTLAIKLGGVSLNPDVICNANAWVDGATMDIDGKHYSIKRNEPQVIFMKLPSIIMKGFITVPAIDVANCNIETCEFIWYRQISARQRESILEKDQSLAAKLEMQDQSYWLYLTSGLMYSPEIDDVGHHLKVICRPSNGSKVGPSYHCSSPRPIELGPPECPFGKRQLLTRERHLSEDKLRFVSYNILADLYADSEYSRTVLFAHCPPHALEIDYRRQLLLKEIHGYNADIVCLQEVDKKEFSKTYEPYFNLVSGHQGVFNTKGGQVGEGVATFFSKDRFVLLETHATVLSNLIDPRASLDNKSEADEVTQVKNIHDLEGATNVINTDYMKNHPILYDLDSTKAQRLLSKFDTIRSAIQSKASLSKRFNSRHTILQTSLLKMTRLPSTYVIVANTHLYFAPDADHVRLLQGSVCVKYLEFITDFYQSLIASKFQDKNSRIGLVFCGDMNSTPDCGLFKLLHEGRVTNELPDWKSNKDESVDNLSVETSLRFSSAYQGLPYTNYTPEFHGWLDYIYYELSGFECENVVPLPDHQDVIASEGIPSDVFPSDHLALIANLKIK